MTFFLFLIDILGAGAVVWILGAILCALAMAWQDWRLAARRNRMGMGPSPFAYTGREFWTRPITWPGRAWDWLDECMDKVLDTLD